MKTCGAETSPPERLLLVDDVPDNLAVLSGALEPAGYEIFTASSGQSALAIAAKARPDLILLDMMMPGMDGPSTCRALKQESVLREIPVLFVSARGDTHGVVEGFKAGGVDYIIKPFHAEEVLSRVATHLQISRLTRALRRKNDELSAEIERRQRAEAELHQAGHTIENFSALEATRGNIGGLVGQSAANRRIVGEIRRLHHFPNTSVLILGESGTGKELVARAIHCDSARARAPFVPVNCVAIPSELAESILFGHVKGAFTGATADRKGCFAMADGGTLFLDEIGDMPVSLQVKLLRVLEDGLVTPVGGTAPRRVDVRVIAATNADLDGRIAQGSFRHDLYFRLARYTVATAPLRERLDDLPALAGHFLRSFSAELGHSPPQLGAAALQALRRHRFPGNIRELKNILERAVIASEGALIEPHHLSLPLASVPRVTESAPSVPSDLPLNLEEAEDMLIRKAMAETSGNIAEAARLLGVHRTRIYRRLAHAGSARTETVSAVSPATSGTAFSAEHSAETGENAGVFARHEVGTPAA